MQGSVFYFDVYTLIMKHMDPKTRFNFSRTCKRFFWMFTEMEKKWMYIGMEPIVKTLNHPSYKQCEICKDMVKDSNHFKHCNKCKKLRDNRVVCLDCLQTYPTGGILHMRTFCNSKRCKKCGDWNHKECPFDFIPCKCGKKHLRGLFQTNCNICDYIINYSICPYDIPRCGSHRRVAQCTVCLEENLEYDHECTLFINRLKCRYGTAIKKAVDENVYLYDDGNGKSIFLMHVKDSKDIPDLSDYLKDVYVILDAKNPGIMVYTKDRISWYIPNIPKQCNMCGKTQGKLGCCSICKTVYYCGIKCQNKDWKNHKLSH